MSKSYYFFSITFLVLLLPCVTANLVVAPINSDLNVYKDQQSIFGLNVTNNFTYSIYNVSFTKPSAYFAFPVVDSLAPGESRTIPYSVRTDAVLSSLFVSTASFFYPIEYNLISRVFEINISDTSFTPNNLTIMQNDSVSWHNLRVNQSEIKDLGSGFPTITVPALSSSVQSYPDVASYVFYEFPSGFTGFLNVIPRSNIVMAHDSSLDVPITFNLHSTLNPSTLQINLLTFNFTSNDNQTQYGVLEIKNAENIPLVNVVLNDSRGWIQFSENSFTLNPLQNKLVSFNITPKVYSTNETNITLIDRVFAQSTNGGNASADLRMLINYKNFDTLNINGTIYTINVLGINDTATACNQHRKGIGAYDVGFEECIKLEVVNNVTVIRETPAIVTVTEDQAKTGWAAVASVGETAQRIENYANRVLDAQSNILELTKNNTAAELARDEDVRTFKADTLRAIHNRDIREMIIIIAIILLYIIGRVSRILELTEEFRLRVATLQE